MAQPKNSTQNLRAMMAGAGPEPTMYLNAAAPPARLAEDAEMRIAAAEELLMAFECTEPRALHGQDVSALATAARLLIADGRQLYQAATEPR